MTLPCQPSDIELWLLDTTVCAPTLAAIEHETARLADDEIARAGALRDEAEAARWRTGRIALRLLLERYCGAEPRRKPFVRGAGGRPSLSGGQPDFSIADSGAWMLIGIARSGRIGVDLEQPREIRMSPARLELLVAAGAGLGDAPADPLQSWTRVEAFAKAAGPTLAATLARLGIQGHGDGILSAADVARRARDCRADAGLAVTDLDPPSGLVGAVCHSVGIAPGDRRPRWLDPSVLPTLAG